MLIPNNAIIEEGKIRDYLLKQLNVGDKSRYLRLAGYTIEDYWELIRDIRDQLLPCEGVFRRRDKFGDIFLSAGVLEGPNGKNLPVTSIWQMDASGVFRFITMRPRKKKDEI